MTIGDKIPEVLGRDQDGFGLHQQITICIQVQHS